MRYIFDLRSLPIEKQARAGGKASSLSLMMQNLKMNIPSGYVILADGFRDGNLTEDAQKELSELLPKLNKNKTYAVRSSAIGEDGESNSFAGQYETLTDVAVDKINANRNSLRTSPISSVIPDHIIEIVNTDRIIRAANKNVSFNIFFIFNPSEKPSSYSSLLENLLNILQILSGNN